MSCGFGCADPSRIFRDASELAASDRSVHFTDGEVERASVLRSFLTFAFEFDPAQLKEAHRRTYVARGRTSPFVAVARFMAKYECRADLRRLAYVFAREPLRHLYDGHARDCFIVAALADDVGACAAAIESSRAEVVSGPAGCTDLNPLIPANIAADVKDMIPAEYWGALAKGWERSGKHRNRREWAHHFELLMEGAGT